MSNINNLHGIICAVYILTLSISLKNVCYIFSLSIVNVNKIETFSEHVKFISFLKIKIFFL